MITERMWNYDDGMQHRYSSCKSWRILSWRKEQSGNDYGDCPDLLCVSVTPSMNNEDVQVQMREAYELLEKECSEVLIFTDLLCGSPNHAAVRLMMSREDITVVTGYNLAILVELVNRRNTSDLKVQELLNGIEDTLASSLRIMTKEGEWYHGN